ncbi:MFS transporter [Leucobacter alluvii]|uniref:MFS transporter n=1 Tax=Leucobacter alluvii TaxID=340321 RepID=A0ABN3B2M5_9MICO
MSDAQAAIPTRLRSKQRGQAIAGLGVGQILSWGSTFYLLAVLADPITTDTGWPKSIVVAGVSVGLVVAGLASPRIGALVAGNHGRAVLIFSALLLAAGLVVLGCAQSQWWYLGAWVILGLGMSGGLYNGAFAILGHTYGASARSAITFVTLFGGFASSVCWPLSTLLVNEFGWRWTAFVYAGAHLLITAPLYALTIPTRPDASPTPNRPTSQNLEEHLSRAPRWPLIVLVAMVITLGTSIAALMSMHMFSLLAGVGIAGATAVALAALIGPSQVGARLIELIVGRKHHPLWTLLIATFATAAAILLLGVGALTPLLLVIIYGVGIGLSSIASGTVPLALFGQHAYAKIMGRIALPSLLAQAAAPIIGTAQIEHVGHIYTLIWVGAAALIAFLLTVLLMLLEQRRRQPLMVHKGHPM